MHKGRGRCRISQVVSRYVAANVEQLLRFAFKQSLSERLYLIFCVPLNFLDALSGPLQRIATTMAHGMLDGMGIDSGIDLKKLIKAAWFISDFLCRPPVSSVAKALKNKLD